MPGGTGGKRKPFKRLVGTNRRRRKEVLKSSYEDKKPQKGWGLK